MSVVLLVRHGQASWGAADYDRLSPVGERQSRVLGATLAARGLRPDVLVRGRMLRHRQTAEGACAAAGWAGEVLEDHGWDEFDHQQMLDLHPSGVEDGEELTRAEFERWFEGATRRWTDGEHAEEYDESFTDFGARVEAALGRLAALLEPSQTAVVFTSGGPVSWATALLLGAGAGVWSRLNPVTVNASVTKVVLGRRGSTLVSFNDHSHLEGGDPDLLTYR
ncbi:MAG: histidine phosphatase family protein [Nocardioidaceae bacterium]